MTFVVNVGNGTEDWRHFWYPVKPLKNRQNKGLKTNGSLMKVESIAECSLEALCYTFDLH